jgi:hypothetical protein
MRYIPRVQSFWERRKSWVNVYFNEGGTMSRECKNCEIVEEKRIQERLKHEKIEKELFEKILQLESKKYKEGEQ